MGVKMKKTKEEIKKSREEKARELEEKALDILEKKKDMYFFCDLADELGYSREWLNQLGVDKLDTIKNALLHNKRNLKRGLRNKWYNSDNATTQVALYKLVADDDELSRLNNNMDVSLNTKGLSIVVGDEKAKEELEDL